MDIMKTIIKHYESGGDSKTLPQILHKRMKTMKPEEFERLFYNAVFYGRTRQVHLIFDVDNPGKEVHI